MMITALRICLGSARLLNCCLALTDNCDHFSSAWLELVEECRYYLARGLAVFGRHSLLASYPFRRPLDKV